MNVKNLISSLEKLDPKLPVEIATSPRPDEWYEVVDVEVLTNHRGFPVLVINTD